MSDYKMMVESREELGTNKVKKLRKENLIPGVVYSRGEETRVLSVSGAEFSKVFKQAGSSSIIDLNLGGDTIPVIVKGVQREAVSGAIQHIDFQKVNMKEKLKISIPIVLVNRDNIKLQPSILMQLMDQIEVECLPSYIPKTADIDVEDMDFSTPKFVRDADVANMEDITVLTNLDDIVCNLSAPTVGAELDETVEEAEEVPVIGEE